MYSPTSLGGIQYTSNHIMKINVRNVSGRSSTRRAPPKLIRQTAVVRPVLRQSVPKQSQTNRFPSGKQSFMGPKGRDSGIQDEYIQDVSGSTGFVTTAIPFNPGQSTFLPRFSKEAVLYEKWICVLAEPYFKPMVSAYATNGQAGKVLLSFDYDASDSPPATKQQVEDSDPHSDAMPYESCRLRLDPSQLNASPMGKYVRPGGLPGSADIKSYDGGILYVSTIGNTNTTAIGELRIRYHFRLVKPVLESTTTAPVQYHVSAFQSSSNETLTTTSTLQTLLFATTVVNGLSASNSSGVITLPPGNYIVHVDVGFTNAVSAANITASAQLYIGSTSQAPDLIVTNGGPYVAVSGEYYISLTTVDTIKVEVQAGWTGGTASSAFGNLIITAI
jgi:hypothetical protein